ncbi:MAG: S-methyl-5-thioribose-1-phosphate isomerase [Leptospiraceae bacterium]|nr:S-methyl-5-thioribose-1-phosphate isomerase [Leptospiraceae bacterium]MCP5512636.1 S-methyl-5-thioribose-1-phosphate isomerase [Leptospiraceae bacterium]
MKNNIVKSILWQDGKLFLLDQRKLPGHEEFIEQYSLEDVIDSIRKMIVRGAPAIAISGIYGMCVYLNSVSEKPDYSDFLMKIQNLVESRPTAVNLRLATEEYLNQFTESYWRESGLDRIRRDSETLANRFFEEDIETNSKIASNGADLFKDHTGDLNILTHCNTGAIATAGIGTALGVIRFLRDRGFRLTVYVSETRPYHQGSRLTSWELGKEGIEHYIITDSMSAFVMNEKKINAVLVGADRIARNGDTANKIGTYSHAIIAGHHSVPFFVAGSRTSFDLSIASGREIPIEMRNSDELTQNSFLKDSDGKNYIPPGILSPETALALNPSFDVTPSDLISGIITEMGVISPVNETEVKKLLKF